VDEKVVGSYMRPRHSRECYLEARRQLNQEFAQLVSRKKMAGG